ncbi:GNAT family N-acetyltransferase [Luteococcus sanguinis]|uniref:GNAT family N-acetyltransferase n=1 Tax=Luteococcus sanguinis TaxID=174038 RepID=A0ABW1WWQ6_9ACTN
MGRSVLRNLRPSEVQTLLGHADELEVRQAYGALGLVSDQVRNAHVGHEAQEDIDLLFGYEAAGDLMASVWLRRQGTWRGRPLFLVAMIYVEPDFRGRGFASKIAQGVLGELSQRFPNAVLRTYVHSNNRAAMLFTQQMGFTQQLALLTFDMHDWEG